jgi:hypothetical protein
LEEQREKLRDIPQRNHLTTGLWNFIMSEFVITDQAEHA